MSGDDEMEERKRVIDGFAEAAYASMFPDARWPNDAGRDQQRTYRVLGEAVAIHGGKLKPLPPPAPSPAPGQVEAETLAGDMVTVELYGLSYRIAILDWQIDVWDLKRDADTAAGVVRKRFAAFLAPLIAAKDAAHEAQREELCGIISQRDAEVEKLNGVLEHVAIERDELKVELTNFKRCYYTCDQHKSMTASALDKNTRRCAEATTSWWRDRWGRDLMADKLGAAILAAGAAKPDAGTGETHTRIGWVKYDGAGEIIFRQAGHPANETELPSMGWKPVVLEEEAPK